MTSEPENYDPPHGSVDPGRWQVHLALDPEDVDAIERAAPTVLPAESVWVHVGSAEAGVEPDVTLVMLIFADTGAAATARASYDYSRIREAAGFGARPSTVLGYQSPWWREGRRGAELAREAHQLHKDGRHELAIVRIQTACEVRALETFAYAVKGHPQETAFGGIQFKPSLMDRQSKALLQLLSGKRIQEEPWWPDYCNHVKRRNLIVHAGLEVDRDGAMASLKVALSFQRWLLDVSKAMLSHGGGTLADDTQHQTP